MSGERSSLPIPSLDDFAPRAPKPDKATQEAKRAVDAASKFPSREAGSTSAPKGQGGAEVQLNMKGPQKVIERFKKLCKDDRRSYYAMLEILMDHFEKKRK